jgi:hypothetical protein
MQVSVLNGNFCLPGKKTKGVAPQTEQPTDNVWGGGGGGGAVGGACGLQTGRIILHHRSTCHRLTAI